MDRYLEFVLNHYMLSLAFAVVTFLLIQDFIETALRKFKVISPILAVTKMNNDETVVIDVRDESDFIKGHIENAQNVPLGRLDERLSQLNSYKDRPLIVVCQTGTRTTPACRTLTKNGFKDVYSLTGGMQSWEENNLPIRITAKEKS